jgi:hypothetical protein
MYTLHFRCSNRKIAKWDRNTLNGISMPRYCEVDGIILISCNDNDVKKPRHMLHPKKIARPTRVHDYAFVQARRKEFEIVRLEEWRILTMPLCQFIWGDSFFYLNTAERKQLF